jgi:GNAT superfamily N-acetyltransferase
VFPREKVARTIYGSGKVHHYLASLVELADLVSEHILWGAWIGQTLAGYIHARQLERNWHLNEIATLPRHQGKGIGRSLFRKWIELGQARGFNGYSLDVDPNSRAYQSYLRRGFEITKTSWTYEKQLPSVAVSRRSGELTAKNVADAAMELSEWESAQAWQKTYGFSRFRLTRQGKTWSIGRLGTKYFRVNEPVPLSVEQTLVRVDPNRQLIIVTNQPQTTSEVIQIGVSVRMTKDRTV